MTTKLFYNIYRCAYMTHLVASKIMMWNILYLLSIEDQASGLFEVCKKDILKCKKNYNGFVLDTGITDFYHFTFYFKYSVYKAKLSQSRRLFVRSIEDSTIVWLKQILSATIYLLLSTGTLVKTTAQCIQVQVNYNYIVQDNMNKQKSSTFWITFCLVFCAIISLFTLTF